MSVRFNRGDVVFVTGASARLGDVLDVDHDDEAVTVAWRPITTTEDAEDLWLEGEQDAYEAQA